VVHANEVLHNNLRHSEVITAFISDTLTALIYRYQYMLLIIAILSDLAFQ